MIVGYQCQQEMEKVPNFTNSEWLKTPKTDCALKVYQDISLDSRFIDLENWVSCHLINFHTILWFFMGLQLLYNILSWLYYTDNSQL